MHIDCMYRGCMKHSKGFLRLYYTKGGKGSFLLRSEQPIARIPQARHDIRMFIQM
jgi:hypothetical protein